ncbi:hypothetical protein N9V38_04290, partial [Planktomarina temperata]|nr:hypothetical protein [Planktomarina temperata]
MTNILKRILSVLFLLSIPMGANSATYSSVSVSSKYSDPWAAVTIRLKNLKIDGDSTARNVAFELHSNKSYYNKTYIEFSGQTFGYGKIPINMTYKKRGDFYFHAGGGDPVSIRQIRSILPAEEKLILRGVCDFVKDRNNAQMIFDEAIKNSYGAGKKHWERFRSRMVNDTVNVGRVCASKLGGQKVTFLQSKNSLAKSVCGYSFSEGKSQSDLKSIQRGLAKRNLYNGGIDGKFGKGSCSALEKWAKCENVGSKVLTGGALAKLTKTEPSARELSCYGNVPAPANEPKILSVSSSDSYVNSSGRHTIISVEMKNRWGNLAEFKLNGYVRGTRPNGLCLVYRDGSNKDKCFSVYDSTSTLKNKLATFNKRDKENITDACTLTIKQIDKINSRTKNPNARTLLNQKQGMFTNFAYKCLVAIQTSFPETKYAAAAQGVGAPKSEDSNTPKVFSGSSCASGQSKLQVRFNQNVLRSLDLYTSTVDGISGPNYRKAVAGGEKLLRQWVDENKNCLGVTERKILEAVVAARKRGSSCEYLPNSTEIKNRFNGLQSAGVIDRAKLDHEKASGLIWMIDTVSDLEMRLSFLNFYSSTNSSIRDCRLDNEELKALKPEPEELPVSSEIPAESISMAVVKTAGSATLSLVVEGSDLETSLVSKSIFGLSNQVKMDIIFDMSGGSPILDLVVSEDDTKINLHFFDNYSQS